MVNKWAFLIVLYYSMNVCNSSVGDNSLSYMNCCQKCSNRFDCSKNFGTIDWVRGNCFWCRYDCMWETTELFERSYGFIPKFHGKWPFYATSVPGLEFVIQEPASVVFSLFNLITVFVMLRRIKQIENLENRNMWIVYAYIGLATWICSTIFHMIDCDVTEKMDYFTAFSFVLAALYVSLIFTRPSLTYTFNGRKLKSIITFAFVCFYCYHIISMINHFDYGYNMNVCIVSSILTTILYLYHLINRKRMYGSLQASDILLIRLIVWANLSTALEILDFVPVFWIFDSHSLFHLATVPIPLWWADFLYQTFSQSSLQPSHPHKIA